MQGKTERTLHGQLICSDLILQHYGNPFKIEGPSFKERSVKEDCAQPMGQDEKFSGVLNQFS